jgi:hypothetical protein
MPRHMLGKHQSFTAVGQLSGKTLVNDDVREVTINEETANEAEVTTRGSGDDQEFVPVHRNTSIEASVLYHELLHMEPCLITIRPKTGFTGKVMTGMHYLNNIGTPQTLNGEVVVALTFRRTVGN